MKFFSDIKSSVYDPKFYANIPNVSGGRAIGYLALLAVVLALVHTAFISPGVLRFQKQIPQFVEQAIEQYPDGLEVNIIEGQVSTNAKEPFFIKAPGSNDNILVIDTKNPYTNDQFEKYNSPVWLTKDSLITKSDSKTEIQSLEDIEEFKINSQLVDQTGGKLKPFVAALSGLLVPFVALGLWLYYFVFKLTYMLFAAFLILFSAKAFKLPWKYSDAYKAGLFAITPALLISLIFDVFNLPRFMMMFTIITGITIVVNLAGIKPAKTS